MIDNDIDQRNNNGNSNGNKITETAGFFIMKIKSIIVRVHTSDST